MDGFSDQDQTQEHLLFIVEVGGEGIGRGVRCVVGEVDPLAQSPTVREPDV